MQIQYVKGDATEPIGLGNKVIVHCCNNIGKWGKGFVLSLSKKWKDPEIVFKKRKNFVLGEVDFIKVENNIWIANIIGQHGIYTNNSIPPIRYWAIRRGLEAVKEFCVEFNAIVHMPRIGCGLAGGNWQDVEYIINEVLIQNNIMVVVYDL